MPYSVHVPDTDELVVVPLMRLLNVEGNIDGSETGAFRGVVIALGWLRDAGEDGGRPGSRRKQIRPSHLSPPPEPHYLVSDLRRPSPIWVHGSAIAHQYHGAEMPFPRRDEGAVASTG